MELWLIRHTTPDVEKGTCYGQLDLDVDNSFERETSEIREKVNALVPDAIFSSPLKRCQKLAKALFPDQAINIDERLMELNFGDWEGQLWANIPYRTLDDWSNNFVQQGPPNGESFQSLLNRTHEFESLVQEKKGNRHVIVTHAGIIRAFLMQYLQIPANKAFSLQLNYGAIVKITIHSKDYQQVEFIKG